MKTFEFTVKDKLGMHARPAGIFSKFAKSFDSQITVTKENKTVNASKLLALMSMGIKCGDTIIIKIEGTDEDLAESGLKKFLAENL